MAAGWSRKTAQVPVSGLPSAPMKFDVRVPSVSRSDTVSPAENACGVVLSAARLIVNESPDRAVHATTSSLVAPALAIVSKTLPPPDGLGKLAPLPAVTVSVVSVADRLAASFDATGENAKSRMPRNGACGTPRLRVSAAAS